MTEQQTRTGPGHGAIPQQRTAGSPPRYDDDAAEGWVRFAAVVMAVIGTFGVIEGLVALFAPTYFITLDGAVLTIDLKHVSGNLAQLSIGHLLVQNLIGDYAPLLVTGKWKTIACIAQVAASGDTAIYIINGAGGSQVLRLSAAQVMQFDTQQEAVDYYNAGGFAL